MSQTPSWELNSHKECPVCITRPSAASRERSSKSFSRITTLSSSPPPPPPKQPPVSVVAMMGGTAPLDTLLDCESVWELSNTERRTLHAHMLELQHADLIRKVKELAEEAATNQEQLQVRKNIYYMQKNSSCRCVRASGMH